MDTEPSTTGTRVATLEERLGIPRAQFKAWRDEGSLLEGEHWVKEGNAYLVTEAGEAKIMELLKVTPDQEPSLPERVAVVAVQPGAMVRVLRCRRRDTNAMVSVRLLAARTFAAQFQRGVELLVLPTDNESIFEYEGAAPRRARL